MAWIGGALAAGGSLLGGMMGSDAADEASQRAANSASQSMALQKQMYDQTRADQAPWRYAGVTALGQLSKGTADGGSLLRAFNSGDFQADPGYQFRMDEGIRGVQGSGAARGMALSGGMLKGLNNYAQGMASNEYGNAFNRYQTNQGNQFNRLASMAGLGQTANGALQQAGNTYANGAGNALMSAGGDAATAALVGGQMRASSYAGAGNALGRAFASPSNPYGNAQAAMNQYGSGNVYGFGGGGAIPAWNGNYE